MDIELEFSEDLFNPLYYHLEEAFNNNDIRFIWLYGGSSASKTFTFVQATIIEMLQGERNNTMIMRKFSVDIKDSIYSDFKSVISDWELNDYFKIQQNYIECTLTGSYCRFRGLDDAEKIKGLANFKRVALEEISQFDEVDLKQIRKRLRGRKGQQIIGLFNPISEEHWIKKNIFDYEKFIELESDITEKYINDKGNTLIMKVTYKDNYWIVGKWKDSKLIGGFYDKHTIDDFERDKERDYNYYSIYALGNWGKLRTGGEFWKDFNSSIHVKEVDYDESLPIHISWDENVNPYLTCLVWQIKGKKAIQIDEICLEDPRNRIKHVCQEFRHRYPQHKVKGLFIYGDRTSWKEDVKKEKGENFFTDIVKQLMDYKPSLRLQSKNPSVVQSASFINEIYARNEQDIEIIISPKCKKSIYDYSYALEDSDGTGKKTKVKHPVTGVMYEEFLHCSDAKRYLITMAFATEYANFIRGGRTSSLQVGKNRFSKHGY